ncbi:MAG TPA: hypothetical protein VGS19_37895 [Streptosporangiaceae bacterium]|nr:hypothetical protein [Streptosporangiaceae bacterium]
MRLMEADTGSSGAKSPSALAPFAYDWVGGDIHGLSAYAGTLYGYAPKINNVAAALNGKVSQIVGDAGWQGSAASAFTKAWDHDATGAAALATVTSATGDVVDWLAVTLSKIESALEQAAHEAASHGVPVGAGGQPPNMCLANAAAESWRASYQGFWDRCMLDAVTARNKAAGALQGIGNTILGNHDGRLSSGDWTAVSDVLAGFLGEQTRYRGFVDLRVGHAKSELADARTKAIEDARQADGRFGTWSAEDRQGFNDAKSTLSSAEEDLTAAKGTENWLSRLAGFSPSDIPAVGDSVDGVGGVAGDLARAGTGIPFVDLAAVGVSTYFGAQEDMAQGVPGDVAYPAEAAGNVAALGIGGGLGIATTGVVATGLTTLGASGLVVSLGAGGAGVLAGGVVAYGVGDFTHHLIDENWGADMNKYGTVDGIMHGIGDSAVKTGEDFGHMASSVWHGITSIF